MARLGSMALEGEQSKSGLESHAASFSLMSEAGGARRFQYLGAGTAESSGISLYLHVIFSAWQPQKKSGFLDGS